MRVIYSECDLPFWVEIASKLWQERGWEPVYWTGLEIAPLVRQHFDTVVFHSVIDAVRGIPAPGLAGLTTPPLDSALLADLAPFESITLSMMDRMDPGGAFSYQERRRLYYRYLRYWLGVLDHFQPNLFLTPISPHLGFDYVLYRLCIHRGIHTLMFDRVSAMIGHIYPVERFEEGSFAIRERYAQNLATYRGGQQAPISDEAEDYLRRVRADSHLEAMPAHSRRIHMEARNRDRLIDRVRESVFAGLRILRGQVKPDYIKRPGVPFERSHVTQWQKERLRSAGIRRKLQLYKQYHSQAAANLDLSQPYVFVAMNYQPERTTSPLGGVFVDQSLMVGMLSRLVPDGWKVYVKDHPRQFQAASRGHMSREAWFYDDLAALPNVELVPLHRSTFELIDNARAVATVTNTAGWEALIRGKPALVFGCPWYRDCKGVFYTPTVEACRMALEEIQAGYAPDPNEIRTYLHTIEEVTVRGYIDHKVVSLVNVPEDQNADRIYEILRTYRFVS